MAEQRSIRFNDGAAYDRMMGQWSRLAGAVFLDWLAPLAGLSWVDIGCGTGTFTRLVAERCEPRALAGIDPSEDQLAFARTQPTVPPPEFRRGDAMALPFADRAFDAATMALVIFFVPDPAKGVAEMRRVVRPGGIVAAYAWDMFGGGFPLHGLQEELRQLGKTPILPPSAAASRLDAMTALWRDAGLDAIETRVIAVERGFADFDEFWSISLGGAAFGPAIAAMPAADVARVKAGLRARLAIDAAGRVTARAHAHAIKGRVPG